MKTFVAACIAAAIVWGVDVEFNNGRYTEVVKTAIRSALAR
jgi:hypothetical protein